MEIQFVSLVAMYCIARLFIAMVLVPEDVGKAREMAVYAMAGAASLVIFVCWGLFALKAQEAEDGARAAQAQLSAMPDLDADAGVAP